MVLLDVSHKIEAKGVRFKHVLMFVVLLKLTPSCLQYAAILLRKDSPLHASFSHFGC